MVTSPRLTAATRDPSSRRLLRERQDLHLRDRERRVAGQLDADVATGEVEAVGEDARRTARRTGLVQRRDAGLRTYLGERATDERLVRDQHVVIAEPLGAAVGPVPQVDRLDRERLPEVDLPPGLGRAVLGRVGHRPGAPVAVGVAVDGPLGDAAVRGAAL